MEPTIRQENSGSTKLRVERELTDLNPLVRVLAEHGIELFLRQLVILGELVWTGVLWSRRLLRTRLES